MTATPEVALQEFNAKALAFLNIHRQTPTEPFIANLRTRVESIKAGEALLPVTINDGEPDNTWICSPYTTYCSYAADETTRLRRPVLGAALRKVIHGAGALLKRAEIDRHVAINNWLVSTNCYPRLSDVDVTRAIDEAKARWPGHSIWFRSLNAMHHADWLDALVRHGGVLLPSRQVYLFENVAELARRHRDLKHDFQLLRRNRGVTCAPMTTDTTDFARTEALYADLYVRKYSCLNPQYSSLLLHAWTRAGLLRMHGLHDSEGVLQGVVGLFGFGSLLTSPIVGYNTALPRELGLYRRLAACVLHEAAEHGLLVNLSAGVAHFKRQRGGRPAIEYSVVVADHLPSSRRNAIRGLALLARYVGVPIMRTFKL
jgi:hypothetical protein